MKRGAKSLKWFLVWPIQNEFFEIMGWLTSGKKSSTMRRAYNLNRKVSNRPIFFEVYFMKKTIWILLFFFVAGFVVAQPFNPVQRIKEARERAAAVRAARLDALRQLGESIKGVRIDSHTTVKDFVTQSDTVNAQFEGFLRGAQQEGKVKIYDDGTVEITMVLYIGQVVKGLQKIAQVSYSHITPAKIQRIRYQGKRKFSATGSGAMKMKPSPASNDDLWQYVTGAGKLMARRAAQIDAYRNMGETVYGIQISSKANVKDFVTQSDFIRARFSRVVRGVQIDRRAIYRPEGIVEVNATLNVDHLIHFLSQMRRYSEFSQQQLENIRCLFPGGVIHTTGVGAPPARYIRRHPSYRRISTEPNYERVEGKPQPKVVEPVEPVKPVDPIEDPQVKPVDPNEDPQVKPVDPNENPQVKPVDPVVEPVKPDEPVVVEPVKPKEPEFSGPPSPPGLYLPKPTRPEMPPLPKIPERFVPEWAKRHITATGTGSYPENMRVGQARAMARRAAQVEGYRQLLENAIGVKLDAETTVKDFIAQKDKVNARVNESFLRGARTVGERDKRDEGVFEVDMKLYLGDMWEIIDAEYNKVMIEKYGKQLLAQRPNQRAYNQHFGVYAQKLEDYKRKCQSYQAKLEEYYRVNHENLALGYEKSRRFREQYKQYQSLNKGYNGRYQTYQGQLDGFRKEVDDYIARYKSYYQQYQNRYNGYKNEADVALMAGPPVAPKLAFSLPKGMLPTPPKVPERFVPKWAQRDIYAKGTGVYPLGMPVGQARAMAKRAAQVDAYRLLVESAQGVKLQSETSVKDFIAQNDKIKARVKDAFLRGAQTVGGRDVREDGYFEVKMKLYLGDMWEIIDAEYNKVLMEKYGKKLEEYQPDQRRYNSALAMYKGHLETYKRKFLAYQDKLQNYYREHKRQLDYDYPVAKKFKTLYHQYYDQSKKFAKKYNTYRRGLAEYERKLLRQKALYQEQMSAYKRLHRGYQTEAKIALTPAPPAPPSLHFITPKMQGVPSIPKPPERVYPKWAKRYITATGTGVYPKHMQGAQAMAMAKRAAQVDAYRLLVESAMGVRLDSKTTVKDFITRNDQMTAKVKESFLRGAQAIGGRDVPHERYYEVKMKLYLGDMWEIIDAAYNKVLMEKYGKKLEDYQPDQLRYKTEMEAYKAQLKTYKLKYTAYQKHLETYFYTNKSVLSERYPVARKYSNLFKKYREKSRQYTKNYQKYEKMISKYYAIKQAHQAKYDREMAQYRRKYEAYKEEAEAAMTPAPPAPPALAFVGPKGQDSSLPEPPTRFVPEWAKRYITATGTGVYPKGKPLGQARLLAKRAAQVDAYRILVENALGVRLKSATSVKNFITQKDRITAKVNNCFLRGAQVVTSRNYPYKRYCEVDMKLYLGDMWKIIDAEYNKVLMKQYGKKLEDYQPDQARYRTETELYQAQLRSYKARYEAYQRQLREYYRRYGLRLSKNYPVTRKYRNIFQKYQTKAQYYPRQYEVHKQTIRRHEQQFREKQVKYQQYKERFREKYQEYQEEVSRQND